LGLDSSIMAWRAQIMSVREFDREQVSDSLLLGGSWNWDVD